MPSKNSSNSIFSKLYVKILLKYLPMLFKKWCYWMRWTFFGLSYIIFEIICYCIAKQEQCWCFLKLYYKTLTTYLTMLMNPMLFKKLLFEFFSLMESSALAWYVFDLPKKCFMLLLFFKNLLLNCQARTVYFQNLMLKLYWNI